MIITLTALKEKLRRKELYIVSVIGVLILFIFSTGTGTISIDGKEITEYETLAPILLVVVNAVGCVLSSVMSVGTIPSEYERKTSHLIWIRGVSQSRYHGELALANVISGLASEGILFIAMGIFAAVNDKTSELLKLIPAYLIIAVNIASVCLVSTALSIILPKIAAGALSAAISLIGIFHSVLYTLKDILGGFGGELIKYTLKIIPDLHSVQTQAGKIISGDNADIHIILKGLLAVYIFTAFIFIFKRKEA